MSEAKRAPIDLPSLTEPIKSITIDGDAFAWDEATDPAWAGDWAFPPKGWDDANREMWIGTQGHLIAVKREHAAVLSAGDAFATSAEYLLANARAEVAETIRNREIDQRRLDGAKAWTKAREQYGAPNLRTIPTVEGDVVIMKGMTAKEVDAANAQAQAALDLRLKDDAAATLLAQNEYTGVQRDWMLAQCVWPDKERIRAIADMRPSLWSELALVRNEMARARIDDEGKGFAP